jgi:hypothetical protein
VTRQLNGDGFLITAYRTSAIKEACSPFPKSNLFKAEAPLREALTKIWEQARSQEVEALLE